MANNYYFWPCIGLLSIYVLFYSFITFPLNSLQYFLILFTLLSVFIFIISTQLLTNSIYTRIVASLTEINYYQVFYLMFISVNN